MASYNKIIMIGNLTRDPQLSYTPTQMPVVDFGLASNRRWKGKDGQPHEAVCFIDCRAFGKTAETINQYLAKGRAVLVEGRLDFDTWEGKDGTKRSKHRISVESFQFVGPAPAGAQPRQAPQQAYGQAAQPAQAPAQAAAPQGPAPTEEPAPPPYEEDAPAGGEEIPF